MSDAIVAVPCPLCGARGPFLTARAPYPDDNIARYGALYGGRTQSSWKICGGCGFVHQNPRPSVEALNEFYRRGAYHAPVAAPQAWRDADAYMKFARWYYDDKVRFAIERSGVRGGQVFEMGFGYGGALKLFEERGWRVTGVEPDPRLADYAHTTLGLSETRHGILDENTRSDAPCDLVFSNHAFEHVADLHGVMRGIRAMMRPGGYLFTAVPTYAANRSNMSLRWMNAGHYSMFTGPSFDQLCVRHGFEPVEYTYRGWHKEIDDLWHVARYTGEVGDPTKHYEDPARVARFVNWVNPLRSALYYPVYADYAKKVQRVLYVQEGVRVVVGRIRDRLRG